MTIEVTASGSPISVTASGTSVEATVSATTVSTTASAGQGPQGDKGSTGATGAPGPANTLTIGTVASGATAAAKITGTAPAQTLNLTLPKGDKGDTGATGATGAAPYTLRGAWSGSTVYHVGDAVTHEGSLYWLPTTGGWTIGGPPPGYNWQILVAKGDQGDDGDTGPPGTTTWAGITDKPSEFPPEAHGHTAADVSGLATVATSGSYADLSGAPSLATVATSGSYADLSGAPSLATVATSGSYADLSGAPSLATVATSGSYADLSGTPSLGKVATSDNYADLTGTPSLATVATSGSYADLSGLPSLVAVATSGAYSDLTGTPALAAVATSGKYADITGTPSLSTVATTGKYSDLSGTPSSMTPTAHAASHKSGGTDAISASDIGAAASSHTHTLSAITDAGTAASKAVPASGNASGTQVVLGSDTRLSDARSPTGHAHGNLTNAGLISGSTSADYVVVTTTGGALAVVQNLYDSQVYVTDQGTGNFGTDDYIGAVFQNIDGALNYTNGAVNTLSSSVSTATTNVSALQTADTYLPGYDGIADADNWVSRVTAQGASISTATRAAVTRFCVAIAAAGLRSKIWRMNVFVGNSISAAMVPIYRGPSRSGTQYGNTIDTNNNFSSASWTEAAGLVGNGSTRYLTLGTPSALRFNWSTGHIGIDYTGADATDRYLMGATFNESLTSPRGWYSIWGSTTFGINGVFGNPTKSGFTQSANLKIVNRSSSTSLWFYESGERVSTETITANTSSVQSAAQFCVMAYGYQNVSSGTPTTIVAGAGPAVGTCRGYTIGDAFTQFQAYAFGAAWLRLQQELGRS